MKELSQGGPLGSWTLAWLRRKPGTLGQWGVEASGWSSVLTSPQNFQKLANWSERVRFIFLPQFECDLAGAAFHGVVTFLSTCLNIISCFGFFVRIILIIDF